MACVSHGYPLPTEWTWYKEVDGTQIVCVLMAHSYNNFRIIFHMLLILLSSKNFGYLVMAPQ